MSKINQQLNKKTAFITGATSGIGEGSAKYLASIGLNVVIFGRSQENGKRVEKEIQELKGGEVLFIQGDTTSENDVKRALEEGEKRFGSINFVFVNSGVLGENKGLLDHPISGIREIFEVNLFGALVAFQQSAPFLKKTGSGVIVFNNSILGTFPRSLYLNGAIFPYYSLSKNVLDGLVKMATSLEKTDNIKVYSVNPSIYKSNLVSNCNHDDDARQYNFIIKKGGNPRDIGRILEHLFDGSTKYSNGTGIICENDVTFPTQFFYDNYTTDTFFSVEDLIQNHLRDVQGVKLSEERITEIKEELKKVQNN